MAGDSDILESWKEIAAYLKRDVTTVQRWEKREALPVHRHQHDKSGSVFALKSELDRWRWQRTHPQGIDVEAEPAAAAEPAVPVAPVTPPLIPGTPSRQTTARRAALFAVGLVALLLTTGALVTEPRPEPPPRIMFNLTLDAELSLVPSEAPSISPDGASVVFVGIGADGITRLHLRPIGELEARPLPGTEGARYPFWSADSRQVAFFADRRLKAVATSGGEPRAICEAPFGQPGTWNDDGVILFPLSSQGGLYQVRVEGGAPVRVTHPDLGAGDFAHRVPHFLPDGRRFLFLVRSTSPTREGIYVASLDSGAAPRQVMRSESEAWYSSGHLLFVQPPALMAQAFDLETLTVKGAPFALSRESSHESYSGRGLFSTSTAGTVVYSTMRTPMMRLVTVDREGRKRDADIMPGVFWDLAPSPGGTQVAMTRVEPGATTRDIWSFDLTTTARTRLTSDSAEDAMPVWSPAGNQLAFSSRRFGTVDVFVKPPTEDGREVAVVTGKGDQWVNDWSGDGAWLLYSSTVPGNTTRSDLYAYRLVSKEVVPIAETRGRDTQGRFSPDGRWIAYSCDATGQPEIYVKPFPPRGDEAFAISSGGGRYPRWRADGQELYFVDGADNLVAATLDIDSAVRVRSHQVVVRGAFVSLGPAISGVGADYAPLADGRFLLKEAMTPVAGPMTVVVNGFTRRVSP